MITRNRQSATRAIMPSLAQCLRIRRSTHASLRRSTRVYFQQHTTSLFRFVRELGDERRPSGVINGLGQHSTGQPLDVQVLYNDQSKENNQCPGNFVREIRPLVAHVSVSALHVPNGFLSVITASLAAGDLALRPPEFGLRFFVISGIFDLGSVRERSKGPKPYIKASLLGRRRQKFRFTFYAEYGVPLPSLALDGDGFDRSFNGPMQFQFDLPHALNAQFAIIEQLGSVTISGESDAVVSTGRPEPWITGRLATLDAREECLESLIQPPQYVLRALSINQTEIASGADVLQLIGLIAIIQRFTGHTISIAPLLQGCIVKAAGFGQLGIERNRLGSARIEPVFEILFDYKLGIHCGSSLIVMLHWRGSGRSW